jgi:RNA polymerase sigma-70 factor, ECF subfamily
MDEVVRLIEAEIPRLRRYARALLRDQDRADDLVQDTLVRGLDKMHLFRSGDIRAWLFTIMHNQYVNSVRRSVKQGMAIVVEKVPLASPPQQLPNLELHELENAIARLSKEQRETLLLVTLEGLKYEQVAQVCDVPIGTVRSRLNRAREELRRMTEGIIARQGSRPTPARREGAPFAVAPITDSKPAK